MTLKNRKKSLTNEAKKDENIDLKRRLFYPHNLTSHPIHNKSP